MAHQSSVQESIDTLKHLQRIFIEQRVPVSGSINLTHRCNLNCVHCYLGERNSKLRSPKAELSTAQWLAIIKQITAAGCLNLLLSGGEILLRPDFETIYQEAVTGGLLVTVFTNGTLLNNRILSLFSDLPPQHVEISLYGASARTYEAITGVKGSYEQCLQGIQGLHDRNLNFKLKTMILTQNRHELGRIRKIADHYGVNFRMDPVIFACLDGNRAPLSHRVDPAEAVSADFADPERARLWREYYKKTKNINSDDELLFDCGAGLTNFHIDPAGTLLPCLMLSKPAYNLLHGNFLDGWRDEVSKLRKVKIPNDYTCKSCSKRPICGICPAYFEIDNDLLKTQSRFFCDLGEYREQAINSLAGE